MAAKRKKRKLKRYTWAQLSSHLPKGKFLVPPKGWSGGRWRTMTAAKVRELRAQSKGM
jgi:hypothetical protein